MSRVHYHNETIRKMLPVLDDLEQTMGWNMRCAYQGNYREGEDFHQGAMDALAQILEHFPKLRRLLDEVEAEAIKCFVEAQAREKKRLADREAKAKAKGFASASAMLEHELADCGF